MKMELIEVYCSLKKRKKKKISNKIGQIQTGPPHGSAYIG